MSEEEGIIPRAIRDLFKRVSKLREESEGKKRVTVSCSYIQLYNEKIYDLLNTDAYKRRMQSNNRHKAFEGVQGLKLKWTPNDDVIIENMYSFECTGPEDTLQLFWKGLKNKMMASHRLNNASSRSHCILTLMVHQFDIKNPENNSVITSKLQLVDLAGSERQSYTTGVGNVPDPQMLKEAIEINKSLFTLR